MKLADYLDRVDEFDYIIVWHSEDKEEDGPRFSGYAEDCPYSIAKDEIITNKEAYELGFDAGFRTTSIDDIDGISFATVIIVK